MLRLGIIGYPLEHSLSPVMHTAAMQQLNIMGEYKTYTIKEENLSSVFNVLKQAGLRGLNVTIPHKKTVLPLLDEISDEARLIEAVNTITFQDNGKTKGDNTDIIGFWESLNDHLKKNISSLNVTVLGYGGSSSAVCTALIKHNVKELVIYGRNQEKLKAFEVLLKNIKTNLKSKTLFNIGKIEKVDLSTTNLLINTTPVGMYPDINTSPLDKNTLAHLPKEGFVYDLIYNPIETKLLKESKALGYDTQNGLDMLVRQGALSLTIWLGKEVSAVAPMKKAVEDECQALNGV